LLARLIDPVTDTVHHLTDTNASKRKRGSLAAEDITPPHPSSCNEAEPATAMTIPLQVRHYCRGVADGRR
jgi:hypothetical protein